MRFRDRLKFEERTITVTGEQAAISWTNEMYLWGRAERHSEMGCTFTIRRRFDVTTTSHRITFFDCVWVPVSVVIDADDNRIMRIECDRGELVEVTHMKSTEREYIDGIPDVRPPE